jgi:hypothetical protein
MDIGSAIHKQDNGIHQIFILIAIAQEVVVEQVVDIVMGKYVLVLVVWPRLNVMLLVHGDIGDVIQKQGNGIKVFYMLIVVVQALAPQEQPPQFQDAT